MAVYRGGFEFGERDAVTQWFSVPSDAEILFAWDSFSQLFLTHTVYILYRLGGGLFEIDKGGVHANHLSDPDNWSCWSRPVTLETLKSRTSSKQPPGLKRVIGRLDGEEFWDQHKPEPTPLPDGHLRTCGTLYRGCDPTCPHEVERLAEEAKEEAAEQPEQSAPSWEDLDPDTLFRAACKAKDENKLDVAEALFRRVLDHRWDEPQVLLFLGQTLTQMRRWQEARQVALQLLAAKPFDPDGLMLAAYTFSALQKHAEAEYYHRRAMEVAPLAPVERWNWSLHCLRHGNWREGWREYEWGATVGKRHRRSPNPAWDGMPCSNGSLYIYPEQGFGDVFMGLRFVPIARRVGGFSRVAVEVPESMATLVLANADRLGVDAVYATQNNGAFGEVADQQISVMSLPRALGLDSRKTLKQWVAGEPFYLSAKPLFEEGDGIYRVGVSWQGSTGHQNDGIRSIPWETFQPFAEGLLRVPHQRNRVSLGEYDSVEVYCLIPNVPEEQRHPDILYFDGGNWQDTAELVASLNLVVTVDTAVGHLAGAMGIPCWLLLASDPDWRWGIEGARGNVVSDRHGEDTEWYPGHYLWRQRSGEPWSAVLERLSEYFGVADPPELTEAQWDAYADEGRRCAMEAEALDAVQEAAENGTTL